MHNLLQSSQRLPKTVPSDGDDSFSFSARYGQLLLSWFHWLHWTLQDIAAGGKLAGGHIAIGGVIAFAVFMLCIVAPLIRRTRQGYNDAAKLSVAIFITLMFSAGTSEVFSPASALIFQLVGFGVMIGLMPVAAVWTFIQSVTKDPTT
ncbi:hypothetical protein [Leucobacter chromiireducens]|uniref:Uncharacterized protein n=1 Tax=Leucobacter chromiireducens subsp. solipictus TaxID=398235 RepID=A0ABS1SGY0_9MICO|nr:hypothetical protein [Leucobacter chromiireducens]MBL3678543.1 hypothetical protein [Leucobacter chromiireducens subsp. solipictus]